MAKVEEVLKEGQTRFHPESRLHYTFPSADELIEDPDNLYKMVNHFKERQLPRLKTLGAYRDGDNVKIMTTDRRREDDVADQRAIHDFAGYITTFMQGYMTGIPINIDYQDGKEESEIDNLLASIDTINDAAAHNSSMANDASCFGRAYEIVYRGKDDNNYYRKLSPLNTFVIYSDTIEREAIAGVRLRYSPFEGESGTNFVEVYTDENKIIYIDNGDKLEEVNRETHVYKETQINELENNEQRIGDFEKVLSLIDLYDAGQSDTANYMEDFNNAILAIFGDLNLGTDDPDKQAEVLQNMRRALLMHFVPPKNGQGKDGNIDAKYLTKSYDVQGTEKYKDRLQTDIHKFSFTPDITDEKFSGNSSGESLKYKMFGLEVVEGAKRSYFKKFLRRRYRLIMRVSQKAKEAEGFDENLLKITITPKLPKSLTETIKSFTDLGGQLTNEMAMRITGIVEDPRKEEERLTELDNDAVYDFQKALAELENTQSEEE